MRLIRDREIEAMRRTYVELLKENEALRRERDNAVAWAVGLAKEMYTFTGNHSYYERFVQGMHYGRPDFCPEDLMKYIRADQTKTKQGS